HGGPAARAGGGRGGRHSGGDRVVGGGGHVHEYGGPVRQSHPSYRRRLESRRRPVLDLIHAAGPARRATLAGPRAGAAVSRPSQPTPESRPRLGSQPRRVRPVSLVSAAILQGPP